MKQSSKKLCLLGIYNRTTGSCVLKKSKSRRRVKTSSRCRRRKSKSRTPKVTKKKSTGRKRKSPSKKSRR